MASDRPSAGSHLATSWTQAGQLPTVLRRLHAPCEHASWPPWCLPVISFGVIRLRAGCTRARRTIGTPSPRGLRSFTPLASNHGAAHPPTRRASPFAGALRLPAPSGQVSGVGERPGPEGPQTQRRRSHHRNQHSGTLRRRAARGHGEGFWTRIGTAFQNQDGSWNLRFDYLPTAPGVTIQMRPVRNAAEAHEGAH